MASHGYRMSKGKNQSVRALIFTPSASFTWTSQILQTAEDKLHLFIAINKTNKLTAAQLVEKAVKRTKCEILENLLEVIPYRIHAILTDNGV